MDKTIELLLEYLKEQKADIKDYSIAVGFGYDEGEGEEYRNRVLAALREKGYSISGIPLYQIGATIGVHTGPYPIGVGVIQKAL